MIETMFYSRALFAIFSSSFIENIFEKVFLYNMDWSGPQDRIIYAIAIFNL